VCFGHQIVARAMGVKVGRSSVGWEASVTELPLSAKGKEVFEGGEMLRIFQMHRDIVTALPEGAENLGSTEKCEIQGLYAPGRYISVQGHPEFTEDIVREILLARGDSGVFTRDELEEYLSRVGLEHDGVVVAKAFLKFIKEGTEQQQ